MSETTICRHSKGLSVHAARTVWIGDCGGAESGARAAPHEAEHIDAGQPAASALGSVRISRLVLCEPLLQVLVDHPVHHGLAYPPVRGRHTLPQSPDTLQIHVGNESNDKLT